MDPVSHFELPVDDSQRAQDFYRSIFGWEITEWPMEGGGTYIGARSVPVNEETFTPEKPGAINGGLVPRDDVVNLPILAITVASIDETVEKVKANGGSVMKEKEEIMGMGYYGYIKDSEGNTIGLWEDIKQEVKQVSER